MTDQRDPLNEILLELMDYANANGSFGPVELRDHAQRIAGLVGEVRQRRDMPVTDQRFKTIRHIEAVRNHLNEIIRELLTRAEQHDQSKLQSPEREMFDEWTEKLRGTTYGSPEYKLMIEEMKKGPLQHHYNNNRHHPEFHRHGIRDMNLIDVIEMFCDWSASVKRHDDGDIHRSIGINQERFGYDELLAGILHNTATWMAERDIFHHAEES